MASRTPADEVCQALSVVGSRPIARVLVADHAVDLAVVLSPSRLAVVRCTGDARLEDYAALETMVTEGDFVWAGLVFEDDTAANAQNHVECFHVTELDCLVVRLSQLQEAYREAS